MEERIKKGDVKEIKDILRQYKKEDLEYNEPHFDLKLQRQKIDRKEVIKNLLKPDKLTFVGISKAKNRKYKYVYDLFFELGKRRIFKIPVSIKPKSLYVITIYKIRGNIQNEAIKYY